MRGRKGTSPSARSDCSGVGNVPGTPARQTYTYVRNGTSDLFAALEVASGKVITKMTDQHRAVESRAFLNLIDKSVPHGLDVHVICDNASTQKAPEIQRWLERHRRFTMHYTPTFSSWLDQVERWFSELTTKKLRRATDRSVDELRRDITDWVELMAGLPGTSSAPVSASPMGALVRQ